MAWPLADPLQARLRARLAALEVRDTAGAAGGDGERLEEARRLRLQRHFERAQP